MQWLQSTFANRCKERYPRGEVFHSRYRAILVEPGSHLAQLVNFIHLNPVRAALRSVYNLESYRWSSFPKYLDRSLRPRCLKCEGWLNHAGPFPDTGAGWEGYRERLGAIADLSGEEQALLFGRMCQGWVIGTGAFCAIQRAKLRHPQAAGGEGENLKARNEREWEERVIESLRRLGKTSGDLVRDRKSAPWKAAIAFFLKRRTSVTNPWLSRRLQMGPPAMVSRLTTAFGHLPDEVRKEYELRLLQIE
jgi:putative transposase